MIKEIKMYGAQCDNCGETWEDEHNGWVALTEKTDLIEAIDDYGWHSHYVQGEWPETGKHYCEKCWSYNDDDEIVIDESRKNTAQ